MFKAISPGIRSMLFGSLLFSLGALLVKLAGHRLPPMEILFARGFTGLFICWGILRKTGGSLSIFGQRRLLLVIRGLFGFLAIFTTFYAIVHLPLADAMVIIFSHPAAVAVLAAIFLGERMGLWGIGAAVISMAGVIVVCRPSFLFGAHAPLDSLAVWAAVACVVFTALAILTIRSLAKTEHPAVVMVYQTFAVVLTAPLFSASWLMPTPTEWLLLLGVGTLMNAGQYYMTKAYAVDTAWRVSAVGYLEIVFAAIWGALFLDEIPDIWVIVGAVMIVGGTMSLTWDKTQEQT